MDLMGAGLKNLPTVLSLASLQVHLSCQNL